MEYYYSPAEDIFEEKNEIIIKGDDHRHLAKVLRKKPGDLITVTDGRLNIYDCSIKNIDSKKIICWIIKKQNNLFEPDVDVTLYISILKNSSRFEFAIEKCVELGVKRIIPVITEHTVAKERLSTSKNERLRKIILSAMKQSQRCYLPSLDETVTFDEMIRGSENEVNKIVLYEFADPGSRLEKNIVSGNVFLCIGPEGGFSNREIEQFKSNHWKLYSLGERKLRAETAAIVSVFKLINL